MSTSIRRSAAGVFVLALLLSVLPLRLALAATDPPPAVNPNLAASCGTDISLVIDRSGSIGTDNVNVRQAAQTFVDALVGTGSKVQVVSFSTTATAEPGAHTALSDLAFVDPATLTIPLFTSNGFTNWDDALEMVRRSPKGVAPLTVMITDGEPTVHNTNQPGHDGATTGNGSFTQAHLDAAVVEANLLKAVPSHMFVVGVGSAVSSVVNEGRIQEISGPDKLTFAGETPNIGFGSADYTLVSSFTTLKTTVARFVRELCGPSLNLVKKLQLADGSTVNAGAADPFTFSAVLNPAASSWQSPAQPASATATLTTTNGTANFAFEPATPLDATTVTLDEAAKTGWVENGIKCWINNLDGTPATVVLDDVGANVAGASKQSTPRTLPPVGAYQAMNCEVYNRQVRSASIGVDKVTAPSGLPDAFAFALKQGATTVGSIASLTDAGAAAVFPPVAPGTYDVVEAPSTHFTQSAATCDNLGTGPVETVSPVGLAVAESSHWQCKFTNTLHNGTITIVKDLNGAPSGSFGFTSNVPGHTAFTLQPTAGANASTSFSVAPGTYSAAEGAHAPFALGATCDHSSTPAAIVVTPDTTTTCTFTNTAPLPSITMTKSAGVPTVTEPGGDVTYSVGITNTSVEPLTLSTLSDVVNGNTINVFTLPVARTTCLPLHNATIAAGATVSCTFIAPVAGNAGANVTDTLTAHAVDGDANDASAQATATVGITDVAPTVVVTKSTATPTLPEPGGPVVYDVTVHNTAAEAVTLTTLTDQVGAGPVLNLTAVAGPITQTTCALGPIAAGATLTCHFTIGVSGNAGATVNDTVKAVVVDDDQTTAQSQDSATVQITDVLPVITVTKDANKATVPEPGASVTYTVGITNQTAEAVVLSSISDQVGAAAPFAVAGTCDDLIGTTLAPHASTSCTFSLTVSGNAGATVIDTVTVGAHDDEQHNTTGADTASVGVTDVLPTITVTKSPAPGSVTEPGGNVTFTVGITNTSVESVTIDAIVDAVGGGTPVDLATIPGTCDDKIGTSLAPGASTSCTFVLFVAGNASSVVNDAVTVSAGDNDGNQATKTATANVTVTDVQPTITVTKSAGVASVPEPGAPVTYTVAVHNTSVEPVTLTSLADVVGGAPAFNVAGVAGTTCTLPQTIPVNGTYSCAFTVGVAGNGGATVNDTVTATVHDDEQNTATGQGSATVAVQDVDPTISVTKVASVGSVSEPGGPVTYTVTVTNSSPESVNLTALSDVVGANPAFNVAGVAGTTCVLPHAIASGASYACGFTVAVNGNAGSTVNDTVTATASDDDDNTVTATASAAVGVTDVAPSIAVTKVANLPSVPEPGALVTYTVGISNLTDEPVVLASIVDVVGGGAPVASPGTCAARIGTTLAPHASTTCSFSLVASGDAGDLVTDTVTVTAHDDEDNTATGHASATVTVTDVHPTITVTKAASPSTVSEPGGPVTYTVTVHNTSPEPVTLTALSDVVGANPAFSVAGVAGTTCALPHVIAVAASYACTFTIGVAGNAGATVTDTVTATATDNDGNSASGQGTANVSILDVAPTITVTKTAGVASVPEPGAPVTYTVAVHNTSAEPVTLTALSDVVGAAPAFNVAGVTGTTCTLPQTIAIGATYACAFTVTVSGNAGATVADTVTATVHDDEQNTATGQSSASVSVTDVQPTIVVAKSASVASVPEPGAPVIYTVTVGNTSPEPVTLTALSDVVGAAPAFAVTSVAGTTCDLPHTIAVGASYSCAFTIGVNGNAGATVTDTVTATASDDDDNTTTGQASASVGVTDVAPSIAVTKTAGVGSVPEPGALVTYTVGISNLTDEPVTLATIADVVGAGAPVTSPGTCAALIGTSVAPHASVACSFSSLVSGDAGDAVSDTVTVTAHDDEDNTATGHATATVSVTDVDPTITVTKAAVPTNVPEPGGPVAYTVTVTNASPESVTLTDLSDVVGAAPAIDVTDVDGTTCDLPHEIAAGGHYTCAFTVAVAGNAGDTVSDTVTATAVDNEDNETTGEGTANVSILDVAPAISVTKTPGVASLPEPGGPVTYTVGIANLTDEAVVLDSMDDVIGSADPVALGGTCAALVGTSLAPHASVSCTFVADALGNAGDDVDDTVTVHASDDEDNSTTGTGDATVGIADVVPTITVVKDANTSSLAAPGGSATFTVTVTNTSPEPVTVESMTDEVDDTTFDITAVAAPVTATTCETGVVLAEAGADGDTYECEFTLSITASEAADITDVVTVVVSDDDDNTVTGDDDATTTVDPVADVAIVKVATVVPTVDQTGTYTLNVTNTGPSTALEVTVVDDLPALVTATSATGAGWTCVIADDGSAVSCTRPSLASGATAPIVLEVAVGDPGEGVSIANTATVDATTPDPDPTNNTSTVTVLPLRVLDASFTPPAVDLPKTGTDIAPWLILADLLLIVGVYVLLVEPVVGLRRRLVRRLHG